MSDEETKMSEEDGEQEQETISSKSVRQLTRDVRRALLLDEWPSDAGIVDFGLESPAHLGALQWAVKCDGVTVEQLDAALGKGEALQALISETNPYRYVKFRTDWDELAEHPEPEEEPCMD